MGAAAAIVPIAIVALTVSGCSDVSSGTHDAEVKEASAGGTSPASQSQQLAAQSLANAARDRLVLAPQLAWARYQDGSAVDDPAGEAAATATFVKAATARGVPQDVAAGTISSLLGVGKAIEVRLIMEWGTGVTKLPTEPPESIKGILAPNAAAANLAIANSLGDLALAGLPADWPAPLTIAAATASSGLPSEITAADLDQVLAPASRWRPPAPPPAKTKAVTGKRKAGDKRD